ncbi:MAG TPA: peptidylprolyl isomerase [Rhizomicrobium sp.]|jgi:cyclophilin family peptidyl-prolyl cis-trans isomerase
MRVFAAALIAALLSGGAATAQEATPAVQSVTGPQATVETTLGTIVIALDAAHAPATVKNFIRYAREKHFDGTVFYRIVPGALIQAGSYEAGGKFHGHLNKPVVFEGDNGLANLRGSVAMAHGDDPGSATAEFFIDLATLPSLDHSASATGFAVFGHVVSGMDVVDQIAQVPLGGKGPFAPDATPLQPVTITKVTIAQ